MKRNEIYWVLNDDNSVSPAPTEKDGTPSAETLRLVMDNPRRFLANDKANGHFISTVFLGINHGFLGAPELFETMVFKLGPNGEPNMGGVEDDRYSTWDEAMAGHKAMVDKVRREYPSVFTKEELEAGVPVIEALLKGE